VLWISDLLLPFEDLRRKGLLSDVEKDIPGFTGKRRQGKKKNTLLP